MIIFGQFGPLLNIFARNLPPNRPIFWQWGRKKRTWPLKQLLWSSTTNWEEKAAQESLPRSATQSTWWGLSHAIHLPPFTKNIDPTVFSFVTLRKQMFWSQPTQQKQPHSVWSIFGGKHEIWKFLLERRKCGDSRVFLAQIWALAPSGWLWVPTLLSTVHLVSV